MHRVIFFQDAPLLHELARSFVGRQEFDLVPVASGEEMIEAVSSRGAELLIAPLRLTDMSAGELCARIGSASPSTPHVLLAGPAGEKDAAFAAGAGGFVPLPWTRREILTAIRTFFPIEERGAARADVSLKVICGGGPETYVAFTKDISATGLFLKGVSLAGPGTRLRLRLRLPGEAAEDELDLSAEVVRRVPQGEEGRQSQGLGVRFIDVPMMKKIPITRFVREHSAE